MITYESRLLIVGKKLSNWWNIKDSYIIQIFSGISDFEKSFHIPYHVSNISSLTIEREIISKYMKLIFLKIMPALNSRVIIW